MGNRGTLPAAVSVTYSPELLHPSDLPSPGGDGSNGFCVVEQLPGLPDGLVAALLRNGMQEFVCEDCGRPWLDREPHRLCPVCNPEHPGYMPGGPTDRERWVDFWRTQLLTVLEERFYHLAADRWREGTSTG